MWQLFWQRLSQDKSAQLCFFVIIVVIFAGIFAPWIAPHDPTLTSIRLKFQPISINYPLGTDNLGRCIFSRLLFGIRTTVFYALLAMCVTLIMGWLMGMLAGYFQGKTDTFIMRLCDVVLSFPAEIMILALVGIMGPGIGNILIAVILVKWAWYARMIRGVVRQYSHRNYIAYARVIGAPSSHILRRHLLPVTLAETIVLASADIGSVILMISALSFLGLGVQPPTPEWGNMLSEAKNVMILHPEQMLPAGIAITVVVTAFNFWGDFLRDVFDPDNRQSVGKKDEQITDA
ncbi:nickel/cobalt ABC transporter permease [Proteus hauseri]|uniref:Permease component of an ABC superfamily nickel transporter n=1 Tax=Proteus hauseri ATCC 700826 TaxID=1354271 RepID=A0AAJ3LVB5_PROHU|nr:nickel/cobalt ABC transporter permease [Proteus hauseri]OAT51097.1 permease component of an ABC superfamily nickel transporter [Proteus hauseri ATCC 700826]QAV22968.1 nickel ABC transporter permease subunit NikC [Proteus hauseri]